MTRNTRRVWQLMSAYPHFSLNDVCRAYCCVRSVALYHVRKLCAAGVIERGDGLRTYRVVERWAWVEA